MLGRVEPVDGIVEAELMIEAVVEDAEVKETIFRAADATLPSSSILASNTSSVDLQTGRDRAAATGQWKLHFFNPVPMMSLVEVIRAAGAISETAAAIVELARELGRRQPRRTTSRRSVSSRILMPFINEAVYALQDGVAEAEAIDTIAKLGFNHPIGLTCARRPDRSRHVCIDHGGAPRAR